MKTENLNLTTEWDKVYPRNEKVDHKKVTFVNHFGITLAADMFIPKDAIEKLPATAVSGPFGAVKEQSSGLYAQEMATRGFLTIAFDPLIHGEKAHSCYMSKDAYKDMTKDSKYTTNKELLIIPGASHTDLYDQMNIIPFDKIQSFFEEYLK